jgi:hypothetical protein
MVTVDGLNERPGMFTVTVAAFAVGANGIMRLAATITKRPTIARLALIAP